jgi:hypothetical protein
MRAFGRTNGVSWSRLVTDSASGCAGQQRAYCVFDIAGIVEHHQHRLPASTLGRGAAC